MKPGQVIRGNAWIESQAREETLYVDTACRDMFGW
jgi:hypothetical protein